MRHSKQLFDVGDMVYVKSEFESFGNRATKYLIQQVFEPVLARTDDTGPRMHGVDYSYMAVNMNQQNVSIVFQQNSLMLVK